MARLTVTLLFVVAVAYVMADECPDGCPCGQVCNEGACADGCKIYGQFVGAGSEAEVMGRKCKCGTEVDEMGRFAGCEEGTEFVIPDEATAGEMWTKNPQC